MEDDVNGVSFYFISQLTNLLKPQALLIANDSWQHRHHTAMRESGGGDGETRTFWLSLLHRASSKKCFTILNPTL